MLSPLEKILPEVRISNIAFSDVIEFLRDVTGINIVVRWREIEIAGIDRNAIVSLALRDVTVSTLLKTVLRDVGGGVVQLAFMVEDNMLCISTLESIADQAEQSHPTIIPGRLNPDAGIPQNRRFSIALSFPGEVRSFVRDIDAILSKHLPPDQIFYDERFQSELARIDLDLHLQNIYLNDARLVVVFACAPYEEKEWCRLEWRAIRDIIKRRRGDGVMIVRLDDAEIPGLFTIDGYIDARHSPPDKIAAFILERLGK